MSFNEWQELTLDDIADIIMGQSPSGDTCNNEGIGSPLLNGPTEFGEFYPTAVQFTTDPKKFSQEGDILFCVRGSTTGRMNWSNSEYAIGRGLAAFRHKIGVDYQHFLKGIIDLHLNDLLFQATGSTFPNVSGQQLKSLKVKVPNSRVQLRISEILASFNSKIENNFTINQTLEEIARTLFKEWFVNFNYPNANGNLKHSEFGEIPESWEVGKFGELVDQIKSSVNPSQFPETEFKHYSLPAFDTKEFPSIDLGSSILSNKTAVRKYSVLFSKLNPRIPRIWSIGDIDESNSICSTEFIGFTPKKDFFYSYVNYFLKRPELLTKLTSLATGTSNSHQRIKPSDLLELEILIPDEEVVKHYENIVRPLLETKFHKIQENESLKITRDSLLPKLMSGEIETNS